MKMIPEEVMVECREKAAKTMNPSGPRNWIAAGVILAIWIILAVFIVRFVLRSMRDSRGYVPIPFSDNPQ